MTIKFGLAPDWLRKRHVWFYWLDMVTWVFFNPITELNKQYDSQQETLINDNNRTVE